MRPGRANPRRRGGGWMATSITAYSAATLLDFGAGLRSSRICTRCSDGPMLTMQAVIFGIWGISELHRRNASLVHPLYLGAEGNAFG